MKKIIVILTIALGILSYIPSSSEAAHIWFYTTRKGSPIYLDDASIKRTAEHGVSVNIINSTGNLTGVTNIEIHLANGRLWVYSMFNEDHKVTYKNFSGYLKDWLMNNGYLY